MEINPLQHCYDSAYCTHSGKFGRKWPYVNNFLNLALFKTIFTLFIFFH